MVVAGRERLSQEIVIVTENARRRCREADHPGPLRPDGPETEIAASLTVLAD